MPMDEGVLQDDKAAVKWYIRAAEQGDARAQFNLGNDVWQWTGCCAE